MTPDNARPSTTALRTVAAARRHGRHQIGGASQSRARSLLGQVANVLADLPLFATAPLYRQRHLRWGSTNAEVASSMAGDEALPNAQFISTRSITINAEPAAVWPWLVQVGCGRGGFYSNDLLDNLARPSATTIVPDLQHLKVGQWIPMSPSSSPTGKTAFRVDSFDVESWILWAKPDSTWSWRLTPTTSGGGTRLVTRIHAVYDWSHPLTATLGIVLMEFGDFAMMRRMLRGIKTRAESVSEDRALSPQAPSGGLHEPRRSPVATRRSATASPASQPGARPPLGGASWAVSIPLR